MITIEKGIPIPRTPGTGLSEALRKMEPGDSVLLNRPSAAGIWRLVKSVPGKFVSRKVDGGIRIWRTA